MELTRQIKSQVHRLISRNPTGNWLSLTHPQFTADVGYLQSGSGTYSAGEWSEVRRARHQETAAGADFDFFQSLVQSEPQKVQSALSLAKSFPFANYDSILELGAGEMIHAAYLNAAFPSVRYCATDYDPFVIEMAGKVSLLKNVEKKVMDATRLTAEDLASFSLVVTFGVEYALTDTQLLNVFNRVRQQGADYLMGSVSTTNVVRWLRFCWKKNEIDRQVGAGKLREHGRMRSAAKLGALAHAAGLRMRPLGWQAGYHLFHFHQ